MCYRVSIVMVKRQDFCIEEGYRIKTELLDWFETQYQEKRTITAEMVRLKQQELYESHQSRYGKL